jgi:SAM-dependent methyltransferase
MKQCLNCQATFDSAGWVCPRCGHEPQIIDSFRSFAPEHATEKGEFDPDFFADLAQLEENYFWFRARNKLLTWALRKYFPQAQRYLEIGVGSGIVLSSVKQNFPYLELHGSELLLAGLAHARVRLPEAALFQMNAKAIPFHEHFDVIGAYDVIEHIEEDGLVLREIHDALKPKGGVIVAVPQHPWLWSIADEISFHRRRYRAKELKEKMQKAGFQILYASSFVSLLLPLVLFIRRLPKVSPADYHWHKEFEISSAVNKLLEAVMTLEGGLMRLGIKFPAGSSLLMIGRRN